MRLKIHSLSILTTSLLLFSCINVLAGNTELAKAFENKDYSTVLDIASPLAKQKDPEAMYYMGRLYSDGKVIPKDTKKAFSLYTASAQKGCANAASRLGLMYGAGLEGLPKDIKKAEDWLIKAAQLGEARFVANMYQYGIILPKDIQKAIYWNQQAAKKNDIKAVLALGAIYIDGKDIKRDLVKAKHYFKKAAEQNEPHALYMLALMHEYGEGAERNLNMATKLYKQAALLGHTDAKKKLNQLNEELAGIKVLGANLPTITRSEMRKLLTKKKLKAIRIKDNFFCDIYDPSAMLDGAEELSICYVTPSPKNLAKLTYRFPAHVNTSKILDIKSMVEYKYGPPSSSNGNTSLGEASFTWKKSNTIITVSRGWPDTTVYLTFTIPKYNKIMQQEITAIQKAQERRKAKQQSDAF